ncbi:MAG: SHOCT domain-containing protein [Bacteroidota bacterium]
MANQSRTYSAPGLEMSQLLQSFEGWLSQENFRTQMLQTENGGTLVQVEQEGGWRKLTGMSTALNVVVEQSGDNLNVEIGEGRWLDKVAGGTVGMLLLWPLAVTTAIGAWNQSQMPKRVFQFFEDFLRQTHASPVVPVDVPVASPSAPEEDDVITKLEKLASLKERGILTEEEFLAQKAKILNS